MTNTDESHDLSGNRLDLRSDKRQTNTAIAFFWIALGLLAVFTTEFTHRSRVDEIYWKAAARWRQRLPMYEEAIHTAHGFLYLPHSAISFIPATLLPESLGLAIWRLASMGLIGLGVWRVTKVAYSDSSRAQCTAAIVAGALAYSTIRNGQATAAMEGAILLSAAALANRQYRAMAVWGVIGVAIKPLAIIWLLLAGVLHPRCWRPLALVVLIAWILPFLTAPPSYVWSEYVAFGRMLFKAEAVGPSRYWTQVFVASSFWGWDTSRQTQTVVRVVTALLVLTAGGWLRAGASPNRYATGLYTLAMFWLTLFNPRSESTSYCVIGPTLGWLIAAFSASTPNPSMRSGANTLERQVTLSVSFASALGVMFGTDIAKFLRPDYSAGWMAPTVVVLASAYLILLYLLHGRSLLSYENTAAKESSPNVQVAQDSKEQSDSRLRSFAKKTQHNRVPSAA